MAGQLNSELIIAAVLRKARTQVNPATWLQEQHDEALSAVLAGDQFILSTAFESSSTTAAREIPASVLLQIMESALQQYEAELAAEEEDIARPEGSARWADFSQHPCTLG